MAKQISYVNDRPRWFKLEKYDNTVELDAAGWYEQLLVRQMCFEILSSSDSNSDSGIYREAVNLIREFPIVDVTSSKKLSDYFLTGKLIDLKSNSQGPHYSLGVHTLTTREFIYLDKQIPNQHLWLANRLQFNLNNFLNADNKYSYKSDIDKPVAKSIKQPRSNSFPVTVNLDLPDKVLEESFRQWLRSARKEYSISAGSNRKIKTDFKKWHKYGVLPWLDLTIWCKEVDVTISNHILGILLLPHFGGGEERIRKTTQTTALRLMEDSEDDGYPLSSLATQAAIDLYKKNPEK